MPSAVSDCPVCTRPGRWGFDDDWCHEEHEAALDCLREGFAARHLEEDPATYDPCPHPAGHLVPAGDGVYLCLVCKDTYTVTSAKRQRET